MKKLTKVDIEVRDAFYNNPDKSKKELAEILKMPLTKLDYYYRKLVKVGVIEKRDDKTKLTPELLEKIDKYIWRGLTYEQACFMAKVAPSTYYEYCKRNENYNEHRKLLKDNLLIRAKLNIADSIESNDDVKLSMDYIKLKQRTALSLGVGEESEDEESGNDSKTISLNINIMD